MAIVKDTINLLPHRERANALTVNGWSIAAVVFALIWVALFGAKFMQKRTLQVKLTALSAQKKILFDQVAALQQELGIVGPAGTNSEKASLIKNLLGERVLWSQVFKQFSRMVPAGMWFDSLEGTAALKAEIRIKGGATSYQTISDFMLAMERSSFFEKPQLTYAQKSMAQGHEVVGFEIICGIKKAQGAQ